MIPTQRQRLLPTKAGPSPPFVIPEIFLFTPGMTGRGREPEDIPEFVVIGKPFPAFYPDLFDHSREAEWFALLQTVNTDNVGLHKAFIPETDMVEGKYRACIIKFQKLKSPLPFSPSPQPSPAGDCFTTLIGHCERPKGARQSH